MKKIYWAILIFGIQLLGAHFAYAQSQVPCATREDMRSENCQLGYDLLRRVALAKNRGEIASPNVSVEEGLRSLKSGVQLSDDYNSLSVADKRKQLLKQMLKSDAAVSDESLPSQRLKTQAVDSGTRGGDKEIPEDLWIWFN